MLGFFKKRSDFKNKLKELQSEINRSITGVNSGGCIHFAYFMSNRLTELNIEHKIYFFDYDLPEQFSEHELCNHVMIYIRGIGFFDGLQTYSSIKSAKNKHGFSVSDREENLAQLRKIEGWNEEYNRYQNFKLRKLIYSIIK